MRPLVIDDVARAKVQRVLDHAQKREAWYEVIYGRSQQSTPGDDSRYSTHLGTYRCVFTYTLDAVHGQLFRHLSISVPSEKYPHVAAVLAIAELFGFTGWDGRRIDRLPEGWIGSVDERQHCIVIAQELKPEQWPGSDNEHASS